MSSPHDHTQAVQATIQQEQEVAARIKADVALLQELEASRAALVARSVKEDLARVDGAKDLAATARHTSERSIAEDKARAREAAEVRAREERALATASAALHEAQAHLEATRAEVTKLKAAAHAVLTTH